MAKKIKKISKKKPAVRKSKADEVCGEIRTALSTMQDHLHECVAALNSFEGGVKIAGRRLRTNLQEIKKFIKPARDMVMDVTRARQGRA